MNHYKLVLPENMNPHGSLFGGYLLKWIDEVAFITANLDYPNNSFVTIALDDVVFKHKIECGSILRFAVNQSKIGNTSLSYFIQVFCDNKSGESKKALFETTITFVNIEDNGKKAKIKRG